MKRSLQLDSWLAERLPAVDGRLVEWSSAAGSGSTDDAASAAAAYFSDAALDDVELISNDGRVDGVYGQYCRAGADAPTILVAGMHGVPRVATAASPMAEPHVDGDGYRGVGVAMRFGSMMATVEGFRGAMAADDGEPAVNLKVLTLSEGMLGTGHLRGVLDRVPTDDVTATLVTTAIAWDLSAPTITLGARGRLLAEVAVEAGSDVDDMIFAGAARNPLNALTQTLGNIRDDSGRIAVPGFYHRAIPPTPSERAALSRDGFDPNRWMASTGAVPPGGSLSSLERSTAWPAISVLSMSAGAGNRSSRLTIPGSAKALVSVHLVPDQRPIEIEAAFRSWLESRMPPGLTVTLRVLEASRPYQSPRSGPVVVAQARALKRTQGQAPIPVVGGGIAGSGEFEDHLQRPTFFAGLAGPGSQFGTDRERLSRTRFATGVNVNGEFYRQLSRKGRFRGPEPLRNV